MTSPLHPKAALRPARRGLAALIAAAAFGWAAVPANAAWDDDIISAIRAWFGSSSTSPRTTPPPNDSAAPAVNLFSDLPLIGFDTTDLSIEEGRGAVLRVVRSSDNGETVRLRYATRSESAREGVDFDPAVGTIEMPPGVMSAEIGIRTLADRTHEPEERFFVELSAPREGAANAQIDEASKTVTVRIIDDDPKPRPPRPPGQARAEPSAVDFAEVRQGRYRVQEIIVTNVGGKPLRFGRARLTGSAAEGFTVTFNECRGVDLGAGLTCGIGVNFQPRAAGAYEARLRLEVAGARPLDVPLSGLATRPIVREDPLGARIEALRARRRAGGGAIRSLEAPDEPPPAKALWALRDDGYEERLNVGRNWATLPVDRSRAITVDRHIPCVLEDTLNSQIAGFVHCVVEQHVYGADQRFVLIPGGSRVVGKYESLAKQGDTRLNITWSRFFRPDGASIAIENGFQATDAAGRTGLPGRIDARIWERYGGALLLTTLSVGATALVPTDDDQLASAAETLTENFGDITTQVLEENLDLRPVMTIPAGSRLVILPLVDLWFPTADRLEAVSAAPTER